MALTAAQKAAATAAAKKKAAAATAYKKDTVSQSVLASQYGTVKAVIDSNKELRDLFAKAYGTSTSGQWTATKFQAALQNTSWYKTHSDQWRKTEAIRLGDKTTYSASVTAAAEETKRMAAQMGATLTPEQATALGETFYRGNYNQAQQQAALGQYVDTTGNSGGAAATALKSLQEYGANMGIQHDASYYSSAAKSVASGLSTVDDWTNDIKNEAKSLYVPYAQRIDQGATVKEMASSYVNQMATTLELDPSAINLQDPTIQKALKGTVDQKTGVPVVQPLWDFDQSIKQDPRWAETKNANQLATNTAMNVLQSFGFQG